MSETALQKIEPESFGTMVQRAIDKGVPVETMERLLAMYEKLQARQAKAEFDRALASFQAECPTIQKTKKVMNKDGRSVRYQYAPLEIIVQQVKGLLEKHGFSYTVDAEVQPGLVQATCKATHHMGHSQTSSFSVPIDKDAYMNPAQQCASALTFAKRYAFCNAFGILTGDEDDDSIASHEPKQQARQNVPHRKPAGRLPEPTEAQRLKWIALLKPLGQEALDYAYDQGWLLPPAKDFPGEPLEALTLTHVPRSRGQADRILAEIQAKMDGDVAPQTPLPAGAAQAGAGASGPPSTSTPANQNAPNRQPDGKTGPSEPEHHKAEWYVFPMPWGKFAGTPLGDLEKKYLYGLWANFEVETEYNGRPKKVETIERDEQFREMLDIAGEFYEFQEPA